MNKKTQKGFAHLELLLILIIIAIISFTGYFVWHSRSQANKTLNDAAGLNQGSLAANKKANNPTAPVAGNKKAASSPSSTGLISYAPGADSTGIQVSNDSDIDKLHGASDGFKQFIKAKFDKNSKNPSPCGNAYGLTVKAILNDSFAVGGEGQCGGAEKLWAKVAGQWQEIGGTQQEGFACDILKQYKVPSSIGGKVCESDNGEQPYDQS